MNASGGLPHAFSLEPPTVGWSKTLERRFRRNSSLAHPGERAERRLVPARLGLQGWACSVGGLAGGMAGVS